MDINSPVIFKNSGTCKGSINDQDEDCKDPPLIIPLNKDIKIDSLAAEGFDVTIEVLPDTSNCSTFETDGETADEIGEERKDKTKKFKFMEDRRPFTCKSCNKAFATRQHLSRHSNLHSMEILYPCDECDKVLLDRSYLLRHMKTHDLEKPHTCNVCQKTFRSICNLKRHITVHDPNLRPLVCTDCGKRFPDNSSLKKHSLTHTGVKTHLCTICAKGFSHVGDLNVHMKLHDLVKEFRCDDCGREFSRHNNLVRHRRVHAKDGSYKCNTCKVCFQHGSTLTRHILSHHPGQVKLKKKQMMPVNSTLPQQSSEPDAQCASDSSNDLSISCQDSTEAENSQENRETEPIIHVQELRHAPSNLEIYQIDSSGSLVKVSDTLSIQSLQVLNSIVPSTTGMLQLDSYGSA